MAQQIEPISDPCWHERVAGLVDAEERVLRPANWSRHAPGRGWGVFDAPRCGTRVGVLNLMGRTYMGVQTGSFFDEADAALEAMGDEVRIRVVDMHAEATSEKIASGRYLDGRASAVFGTHTHVQTADERILPGGTAYATDVGMTGCEESIIGFDREGFISLFLGERRRLPVAERGPVSLNGMLVDFHVEGRIESEAGEVLTLAEARWRRIDGSA